MKEFKTNEELINSLPLKGIKVLNKDEALKIVDKYSFYNIVNTYKFPFKKAEGTYVELVTFEEILALYTFDKNIRILFFKVFTWN